MSNINNCVNCLKLVGSYIESKINDNVMPSVRGFFKEHEKVERRCHWKVSFVMKLDCGNGHSMEVELDV